MVGDWSVCVPSRMKILIEKFCNGRMWASECWHRMPNANIVSRNICNSHWFSMKIEDSDFFHSVSSDQRTHTWTHATQIAPLNFFFRRKVWIFFFAPSSLYFVRENENFRVGIWVVGCRVVAVIKKICSFFCFLLIRKTVSIWWFMLSRCDFNGPKRQHKIYYWFESNFAQLWHWRMQHIDRSHFDWRHITEKI